MDQSERLRLLFDRYLRRECTNAEVSEMISLLEKARDADILSVPMEELWAKLQHDKTNYPVDWDHMYEGIENERTTGRSKHRTKIIAAVAVAASVCIVFAWFAIRNQTAPGRTTVTYATSKSVPAPAEKRQTIHLPDGSTVILNAESKLHYPAVFNGRTREVWLIGEAFFDIVHNARQSFIVHCDKITTRVLGTAFNIRAYPADESVEITVARGKVQVMKENKSLGLISANEQISFSKKTEHFAEKPIDAQAVIAWTPQEIKFNDISMEEAVRQIGTRFHLTYEFTNAAIKNCQVTASFSEDDPAAEILTVVCGVSGSSFTITSDKITISGKGCNGPDQQ